MGITSHLIRGDREWLREWAQRVLVGAKPLVPWMGQLMPQSVCRQRDPQSTSYYQCVEDHFEQFEQAYDDRFAKQYGFFRPYLRQVIYRYLDCESVEKPFPANHRRYHEALGSN